MKSRTFLDTNLLVYADDADGGHKGDVARAILVQALTDRWGVVSTQVLQEYFTVVTRKLGLSPLSARQRVILYGKLDTVVVRTDMILDAIDMVALHRLKFWDALILRSAKAANCSRLLTEDLNGGQVIDGILIENPFEAT